MSLLLKCITLLLLLNIITFPLLSVQGWITPDGLDQCNYKELGHCCKCKPCEGNYAPKSTKQELTPFDHPLPIKGERFATHLCVSSDGADSYLIGASSSREKFHSGIVETPIHLFENSIINPHREEEDDDDDSDDINVFHELLDYSPESRGHVIECGDEYLFVSNSKDLIRVFVRTIHPPWSSIYDIELSSSSIDRNTFGSHLTYSKQTKELFVSNPSSGIIQIYKILTTKSVLQSYTLSTFVITVDDDEHHRSVGSLSLSYPFLFSICSLNRICIYKRDSNIKQWIEFQIVSIDSDLKLNGAISSSGGEYLAIGYESHSTVDIFYFRDDIEEWIPLQTIVDPNLLQIHQQQQPQRVYSVGQHQEEDDEEDESQFGFSLIIHEYFNSNTDFGVRLVISDPFYRISASGTGIVYLYESKGPTRGREFSLCQVFSDEVFSFQSMFGYSVALSSTRLIVGSPETSSPFNGSGKIFQYSLSRDFRCLGCDGVLNSCTSVDLCGVCDGDNTSCAGCDGVVHSSLEFDECGVCNGTHSSCVSVYDPHIMNDDLTVDDDVSTTRFRSIYCEDKITLEYIVRVPSFPQILWNQVELEIVKHHSSSEGSLSNGCGEFRLDRFERISRPTKSAPYYNKLHDSFYYRVFFEYSLVEEGRYCIGASLDRDELEIQIGAFKNSIAIVSPANLILSVQFRGCIGCDSSLGKTHYHIPNTDRCNVCGGDGTSCLDCARVPFGDSTIDACDTCTTLQYHNRTCMSVVAPLHYKISCAQTVESDIGDIIRIIPENKNRLLQWTLTSQPEYGSVSLGRAKGNLRYTPRVNNDVDDRFDILVKDRWGNADVFTVDIKIRDCHVIGCDGIKGSGIVEDRCGVCGGNDSCVDCEGVVYGPAIVDPCGVCNGDGSTCNVRVAIALENQPNVLLNGGANVSWPIVATVVGIAIFFFVFIVCVVCGLCFGFTYLERRQKRKMLEKEDHGLIRERISKDTILEYSSDQVGPRFVETPHTLPSTPVTKSPPPPPLNNNLTVLRNRGFVTKEQTLIPVTNRSGSEVVDMILERNVDEHGNILSSRVVPAMMPPFAHNPPQMNSGAMDQQQPTMGSAVGEEFESSDEDDESMDIEDQSEVDDPKGAYFTGDDDDDDDDELEEEEDSEYEE